MYRARESTILGQVVAGLFALWCVYHFYGWWQYMLGKVRHDRKRVKVMLAQDLPAKHKYIIFSATAALCFKLDTEETENVAVIESIHNESPAAVMNSTGLPPPASTLITTHHTYTGQGAYMNGPASFVDLAASVTLGAAPVEGGEGKNKKKTG